MESGRLLAVGLFLVICILMSVSIGSAEQSGPVVAIDLETSASPDLSRIDSVYYGDAEFIYAFLVIDDMPGGYVSGYDLGFEIAPADSGLINHGFTRMPGWVRLTSSDSLTPEDISLPGVSTPAAIGFWTIQLHRGYATSGRIALSANSEISGETIWLLDSRGEGIIPERVHSASVNPTSGSPRRCVPDRVEYVRFNCRGEPIQESRTGGFVPGMVIARFAPGAVELPQGHLGAIDHILSGDIKAIAEQFGMNEVERLYRDAARDDRWITSRTGHLVKALNLWDVYVLHFPEDAPLWDIVDSLRTMPECFYAELNLFGQSCSAPNDTLYKYKHRQWNVDQVGLPSAWDIQPGGTYSVGIGVLDTGIDYNHIDFGQGWGEGHKIRGGWNYIDDSSDFMDDADTAYTSYDSHGTMVSGIAAALTHNHHGLAGVAGG